MTVKEDFELNEDYILHYLDEDFGDQPVNVLECQHKPSTTVFSAVKQGNVKVHEASTMLQLGSAPGFMLILTKYDCSVSVIFLEGQDVAAPTTTQQYQIVPIFYLFIYFLHCGRKWRCVVHLYAVYGCSNVLCV